MLLLNQKLRLRLSSSLNSHSPLNPHYSRFQCRLSTENVSTRSPVEAWLPSPRPSSSSQISLCFSLDHFHSLKLTSPCDTVPSGSSPPSVVMGLDYGQMLWGPIIPLSLNVSRKPCHWLFSCPLSLVTLIMKGGRGMEFSLHLGHLISGPLPWSQMSSLGSGASETTITSLCFLSNFPCHLPTTSLGLEAEYAAPAHVPHSPSWVPHICLTTKWTLLVQGLVLLLFQGSPILCDLLGGSDHAPSVYLLEAHSLHILSKAHKRWSWLLFSIMTLSPLGLAWGGAFHHGPALVFQLP